MRVARVETHTVPQGHSAVRIIVVLLMLLPAIALVGFHIMAGPDLEAWLTERAKGFARRDAFDGVNGIWPYFSTLLGITSLLAVYLVVSHKSEYLLALAVGPLLTAPVYLAYYGITDPEWFALLALLAIGMLVSSSVTAVWTAIGARRQATKTRSFGVSKLQRNAANNDQPQSRPPADQPGG